MDQAATLLELQETDIAIIRAEKRLEGMPEKQAILDVRRKQRDVEQLRAKAADIVSRYERAVSKNEDEVAGIDAKIDAEQAKLMSGNVTNPKEVQNITREMDALKRRKDKLEMEQMDVMEKVEKAKAQVEKVDVALSQLAAKEQTLTEEFMAKGGELQSELKSLKERRVQDASGLEADLLARYEAIRSAKGGVGAGRLIEAACSSCRMELPAVRLQALKAGPDIGECPACKRLLVVRDHEADTDE